MGNAVTFFGALDTTHCSAMTRTTTQESVKVNGINISREGDVNTGHLYPLGDGCATHAKPIANSGIAVFVGGKRIGRLGDALTDCTTVAQGSPTVFAG
jgi:uncharacterized Zn-binding protein involved in type VI secretion